MEFSMPSLSNPLRLISQYAAKRLGLEFPIAVFMVFAATILQDVAEAQLFKSRIYDFEELTAGSLVPAGGTTDKQAANGVALAGDASLEWYDFRVESGATSGTDLTPLANQPVQTFLSTYGQDAPPLVPFSGSFSPSVISVSGNPAIPDSPANGGASTLALDFQGTAGTVLSDTQGMRGIVLDAASIDNNETVSQAANGDIRGASDFSYLSQAWVRPESTSSGQTLWRIGTEQGTPTIVNGKWRLEGVGPAAGNFGAIASDVDVVTGQWTHIAILRTGVGVTMYIDGSVAVTGSGFFNNWPNNIRLGGNQSLTNVFNGQIDDFSVTGLPNGFDAATDLDFFVDNGVVFSGLLGDVDQDNDVDQQDYDSWSMNAGFDNGFRTGDPGTLLRGDVDQNGRIDLTDFNIIQREARAMGNVIVLATIPEPGSYCLLLLAALSITARRSRRSANLGPCCRQSLPGCASVARTLPLVALMVATFCLDNQRRASAEIVVAEDFFYKQQSQSEISGGAFFQSFAGGQNGSAGFWDSDWANVGSAIILSGDFPQGSQITPFLDDLDTGMTESFFPGARNSLLRDYDLQPSVSASQTLYFSARIKVENEGSYDPIPGDPDISSAMRVGPTDAQVSIISDAANNLNGLASFGLQGNEGDTTVDVYANLGGLSVTANTIVSDPNKVAVGAYHTIVGKLEINVAGAVGGDSADFNSSGLVEGGDFLIWQRNFGRTDSAPQSEGNFNGDANVDLTDLGGWSSTYGTAGAVPPDERLTVWINPTGVEMSATPTLVVEADIMDNLNDASIFTNLLLSSGPDPGGAPKRPHYYDDIAIGTTWDDVATVDVPRLTLEVNTSNGEVQIVNNTSETFDISSYEILSESGSLDPEMTLGSGWDSLAQQGESGWVENNPTSEQLIESNFAPGGVKSIGPSDVVPLGDAFDPTGMQDLVARWQVLEGFDSLINIFEIEYVTTSSIVSIPEPSSGLLILCSALLIKIRRNSSTSPLGKRNS